MCKARHAQSTQNKKLLHIFAISPKNIEDEVVFSPTGKLKRYLQVDSITLVCVVRHTRSTKNNNFAMSVQYPKENIRDEDDFWPADKHQRFLQIDTILF